jgi:hypothetical protein
VPVVLAVVFMLFRPQIAAAHFVLLTPESWRDQNVRGDPQKTGPCGDEGTAALTGALTSFAPGETITITLDEVIFHAGHYRVALAVDDRSELPAAPPVTPGTTDCGSAPIMSPAEFPVLADGMLEHTERFSGAQSFQVTLPSDVTCTRCTLQVLEFMTNHAAPCFYHHCADISITPLTAGCETDAECTDDDVCTWDVCGAAKQCIATPLSLDDFDAGFVSRLEQPACSDDEVPRAVGTLVDKAGALVVRASQHPTTEKRSLKRAAKKLRRAVRKVARTQGRRMSAECGAALGTALEQARAQVRCLLAGL